MAARPDLNRNNFYPFHHKKHNGYGQRDDKYRVFAFLQAGEKYFMVPVPEQMQLLRVFALGKRLDYFTILGVFWPSKINQTCF